MKKSIRKKSTLSFADEEDAGEEDSSPVIRPTAVQKPAQERRRAERKSSALSFDDEEDAGQPAIIRPLRPKSALSRGQTNLDTKIGSETRHAGTQSSSAGEYSTERLKELQQSTYGAKRSTGSTPAFVVAGSFKTGAAATVAVPEARKPAQNTPPLVYTKGSSLPPPPSRQGGPSIFEPEEGADDDGGTIPDSDTIRRAKQRRERLRTGGHASDFIGLSDAGPTSSLEDRKDLQQDIDDAKRITFGLGLTEPRCSIPAQVAHEELPNDDEEDEEAARWAEEQIVKGLGGTLHRAPESSMEGRKDDQRQTAVQRGIIIGDRADTSELDAFASAAWTALRDAVSGAHKQLADLESMESRASRGLAASWASLATLETDEESAGRGYESAQCTQAYFMDLCAMLQVKAPQIGALEDEVAEAEAQRAKAYERRRAERDTMLRTQARAEESTAQRALDNNSSVTQGAFVSFDQAVGSDKDNGPAPDLDEFGRDAGIYRRQRVQEEIQTSLGIQKQSTSASRAEPRDGEATTSESEDEVDAFARIQQAAAQRGAVLFADAAEEYATLRGVRERLDAVRKEDPDAYRDIYLGASAPALFAPWVRLDLLGWTPLDKPPPTAPSLLEQTGPVVVGGSFTSLAWYTELFTFGAGDPDDDEVVPRLVAGLVIPRIEAALRLWTPSSASRTENLARLVADLTDHIDPGDVGLQSVVRDITARLKDAVGHSLREPLPSPSVVAIAPSARLWVTRRFWSQLRLLRACCVLESVLGPTVTRPLILGQLLAQGLIPAIRLAMGMNDYATAADRIAAVTAAVPLAWIQSAPPNSVLTELAPLGEKSYKRLDPAVAPDETQRLEAVLALLKGHHLNDG